MAAKKSAARKGGARKAPAARDDDEDEDEDSDEEVCDRQHLEPGQVPVSLELFQQMLAGKGMSEQRELELAKVNDTNFTGLRNTVATIHSTMVSDREYLDKERQRYDDKSKENIALHMQIAEMVRASEDARLERDRLEAQRNEKEMELTALRMRLTHEREKAADEMKSLLGAGYDLLNGIAPIAVPFAAAWAKKNGYDVPFPVPGAGPPPPVANGGLPAGNGKQQYKYTLNEHAAVRWLEVLQSGLGQFSDESAIVLRGLICNGLFQTDGAPPINTSMLVQCIQKDVSPEILAEFVQLTQRAWKPIQHEQTSGANGAAAHDPN